MAAIFLPANAKILLAFVGNQLPKDNKILRMTVNRHDMTIVFSRLSFLFYHFSFGIYEKRITEHYIGSNFSLVVLVLINKSTLNKALETLGIRNK